MAQDIAEERVRRLARAERVVALAGAGVVEVNATPTPLSDLAHHMLEGPAGKRLPALVEAARSRGMNSRLAGVWPGMNSRRGAIVKPVTEAVETPGLDSTRT